MPKFYVDGGDLKIILNAQNHEDAAIKAFKKLELQPVNYLNNVTQVSEKGFNSKSSDDMWFSTYHILELAGLDQIYKDIN